MKIRLACLLMLAAGCSPAFRIARPEAPAPPPARVAQPDSTDGPGAPPEPRLRPYRQVITSRADTKEGLFKVHRIGPRLYYEIPRTELGKDMLLVTQTGHRILTSVPKELIEL